MGRRLLLSLTAAFFASLGLAVAQLLLWPQLKPSLGKALLVSLAWGSWGALWLGVATFVLWQVGVGFASLLRFRPRTARLEIPLLWLALTVACVAFYNAGLTRELLPKSSRQALVVVGVLAVLLAGVGLLLLKLGRKSRLTLSLVGLWSLVVWLPWWGVARPEVRSETQRVPANPERYRRALVLIWEGADIPWLLPMMDRGVAPFLQSLWDRGSWGQVRTVRPFSRAASLTTWATGCSPLLHQTLKTRAYRLHFLGPSAVSLLLAGPWPSPHQLPWRLWQRAAPPRPQVPVVWEVLSSFGVRSQVVGWPLANQLEANVHADKASPEGVSLDPSWQMLVQETIGSRTERANATLRAFSLAALRGVEAALAVREAQPQVLIVHQELPNRLRPLWGADDPGGVLPLAVQLLDAQLAELWRVFGDDQTYLLLLSPYGMAPPGPWDRLLANLGLGSRWPVSTKDSPEGFFFLMGPGVAKGGRVRTAKAADLIPTLFYLLEIPVARTLSGRVLLSAVEETWAAQVPIKLIPAYPMGQQ